MHRRSLKVLLIQFFYRLYAGAHLRNSSSIIRSNAIGVPGPVSPRAKAAGRLVVFSAQESANYTYPHQHSAD